VLTKAGFVPVGPADPAHLGGKPGTWYQRDLVLRDTSEMKITNYGWSTGAGH
jgi:ribosomal-protein-alanine N-acetyltransferase